MFQVFNNGKPADETAFPDLKGYGWECSRFSTFEEALKYATNWTNFSFSDDPSYTIPLQLNIPWDYSGFGDTVEIREVE